MAGAVFPCIDAVGPCPINDVIYEFECRIYFTTTAYRMMRIRNGIMKNNPRSTALMIELFITRSSHVSIIGSVRSNSKANNIDTIKIQLSQMKDKTVTTATFVRLAL